MSLFSRRNPDTKAAVCSGETAGMREAGYDEPVGAGGDTRPAPALPAHAKGAEPGSAERWLG